MRFFRHLLGSAARVEGLEDDRVFQRMVDEAIRMRVAGVTWTLEDWLLAEAGQEP